MAAWTPPVTRSPGYVVTDDDWNDVQNNLSYLYPLYKKTSAKTVAGTTSATDLLNGEVTIPAGELGVSGIVRLTAWGDFKQDSAANRDVPTFRLGLGATTLIDTNNAGAAIALINATRFGWRIVCEIQNLGAANSQWATIDGWLTFANSGAGAAYSVFTTGEGVASFPGAGFASYLGSNSGAVDTTASCALTLKVLNANNSADYETKLLGALVELL